MNVNLSSVCAVNVVGLSAATEMADSRELGRFLGLYQNRVSEHIADCSGILSKRQGGQITAIFCTPNSEEEDAYKAIEAARRIKKSFSELQREFPVFAMLGINLGLSTGKILLGNLEQSSRGEYTAIGRAVDTAERLRDSGTIGTIVLSKEIRNIVGANIQVEKLKPCPLRTEPDGIERFSLNE
jgi:class 3 adenylate cyclase